MPDVINTVRAPLYWGRVWLATTEEMYARGRLAVAHAIVEALASRAVAALASKLQFHPPVPPHARCQEYGLEMRLLPTHIEVLEVLEKCANLHR